MTKLESLKLQQRWINNAIRDLDGITLVESADDQVTDYLSQCESSIDDAIDALRYAKRRIESLLKDEGTQ